MTKGTLSLFALIALALTTSASAQTSHTTTGVALGSDFWTGSMSPELFQLHENGGASVCTGSEVFVTVRGALGFCIDANENAAGAQEFEDARETCGAAGKRLPEPAEYKLACQAGIGGLSNMTDDYEWSSNFWHILRNPQTPYAMFISTAAMGNGSCTTGRFYHIAGEPAISSTQPFRCVR